MARAHAFRDDNPDDPDDQAVPIGATPVAQPGFSRAMTWLVVLSVPLWLLIGAGVVLVLAAVR